eukprot:scaffold10412_cov107-Isochrysis_galbana.AAC.12
MAAQPGAPSAGNPAATAKGTLIPRDRARGATSSSSSKQPASPSPDTQNPDGPDAPSRCPHRICHLEGALRLGARRMARRQAHLLQPVQRVHVVICRGR